MNVLYSFLVFAIWALLFATAYILVARTSIAARSRERLFEGWDDGDRGRASFDVQSRQGVLRRWLFLAGYRTAGAPLYFMTTAAVAMLIGIAVAYTILSSNTVAFLVRSVTLTPGGIGDVFLPIVYAMPWVIFAMIAALPWLVVRWTRRKRVREIERDLPGAMELLATLSEAGLGFDAGLGRVLDTDVGQRSLGREFRTFQADLLAGRTRTDALRRLARRIELPAVSIVISALVQAEQLGTGIAAVLRTQADDLRARRREHATAFAMALPVKRLFPLVICFLPGLFVWTLGPFFAQLIQMADSITQVQDF